MNLNKNSFEKENIKTKVILDYSCIFDDLSLGDEAKRKEIKEVWTQFVKDMDKALTIEDLYSNVKKIIFLSDTEDTKEMRINLLKLCNAKIPDTNTEASNLAMHSIEYIIFPRLNTILKGPQPRI